MAQVEEYDFLVQKIKKAMQDGDKDIADEYFDKLYAIMAIDLKKMASQYFLAGGDKADIAQECRVGLWNAVRDYNSEAGMSFKNFAINVCCKRHLITGVSHANRKKFMIHNTAESMEIPTSEDEDSVLADFIPDKSVDILKDLIKLESFNHLKGLLFEKLTELEKSVIALYLTGASYKEIASCLFINSKAVDNSLMRIRNKTREIYTKYKETSGE